MMVCWLLRLLLFRLKKNNFKMNFLDENAENGALQGLPIRLFFVEVVYCWIRHTPLCQSPSVKTEYYIKSRKRRHLLHPEIIIMALGRSHLMVPESWTLKFRRSLIQKKNLFAWWPLPLKSILIDLRANVESQCNLKASFNWTCKKKILLTMEYTGVQSVLIEFE